MLIAYVGETSYIMSFTNQLELGKHIYKTFDNIVRMLLFVK